MLLAGGLSLRQTQDSLFQELDGLLSSQSADTKQKLIGKNLAQDITKAVQTARRAQQVADEIADCGDLEAALPPHKLDGRKLFAELDHVLQRAPPPAEPTTARLGTFEKDVKVLLKKVVSDSELLSIKYPVQFQVHKPPEPKVVPRELMVKPPPPPPPEVDFEELDALVSEGEGVSLADVNALTTRMTDFLKGAQRSREETAMVVERLLKGEGKDGDPLDQADAAWRRSTLQMLKRGAVPTKRVPKGNRRNTVATPQYPALSPQGPPAGVAHIPAKRRTMMQAPTIPLAVLERRGTNAGSVSGSTPASRCSLAH